MLNVSGGVKRGDRGSGGEVAERSRTAVGIGIPWSSKRGSPADITDPGSDDALLVPVKCYDSLVRSRHEFGVAPRVKVSGW
jgi:hypothetical protein